MLSMALVAAWSWLATTAPAAAVPRGPAGTQAYPAVKCHAPRPRMVRPGAPVRPRRLGELPPGALELAVLREMDNCPIPAILRPDFTAPTR